MAKKHVIKYWARLLQKGTFKESEIPEDIRAEVVAMSLSLPPRESMFSPAEPKEEDVESTNTGESVEE